VRSEPSPLKKNNNMKIEPFISDTYYHIYNRGNNKENIFIEPENYLHFLHLVEKHLLPITEIYSYCLLPNHFHIILKTKEDKNLPENMANTNISQPLSNLFNAYTKAINKKYNRTGSLFQDRFKRIKIESTDYLQNLIIYTNTNSSHHDIENYITYPHSSYKALISDKSTLLEREFVISLFENKENFKYTLKTKKDNIDQINELTFE
jgi:putative transposase